MRAAAWPALLGQEDPAQLLKDLAAQLGFGQPGMADAATRRALGIPEELTDIQLAPGPGTTRMILAVSRLDAAGREQAARLAERLSRKAPHLLWLLALLVADRRELVVAAWQPGTGSAPQVAALVVDCREVLPTDGETLATVAASLEGSDLEVHGRWVEILGRESISRRFFLTLRILVARLAEGASGKGSVGARREVALLYVSRLLFLAFLEAKGWLDDDRRFLARTFDECVAKGGRYQRRVLEPLFFGTLNTPPHRRAPFARSLGRIPFLNGGLFTRSPAERLGRELVMHDDDYGVVFDQLLIRYRFTPSEESATWQETAINPEILGRAFESLMASDERRATGAFYTPLPLVTRVTEAAFDAVLAGRGVPQASGADRERRRPQSGRTVPGAHRAGRDPYPRPRLWVGRFPGARG
jgi:hypothetical protein